MAEKNLGALKREPIKTEHLGLQDQLDRVRDFTNAVMAQEKLIDDLKAQGHLNICVDSQREQKSASMKIFIQNKVSHAILAVCYKHLHCYVVICALLCRRLQSYADVCNLM